MYIPIIRLEITHGLRLLDPWIPHHRIVEVVSLDIQSWVAVLDYRSRVLLDRLVHPVSLALDPQLSRRLLVLGGIEDFVDVGGAAQSIDRS